MGSRKIAHESDAKRGSGGLGPDMALIFKGPIARSTVRTSLALGLRLAVQAGTLLLIARLLGPVQFGTYAGMTALAVLVGSFSTFGTHLVLLAEVAKNPAGRDAVLAYAMPTTLIGGSLLLATFMVLCQFWFSHTFIPLWAIACIGVTETLLLPLFSLPVTEELALEKTARSQLLMILPLALRTLAAATVLWFSPQDPVHIFIALYAATAVMALVAVWLYKPQAWLSPQRWCFANWGQLKHSAGYATLALTALGPSELDKILAAKLLPAGIGGIYSAASRVIGAVTLPVIALLLSALPRLFRHSAKAPAQAQHLNRWIFISVSIYGIALTGALWLAAPFLGWLFGQQYAGIAEMLQWLCFAVPGLALRIAAGSILIATARPWLRAGFEVFGIFILTLTAFSLYPRWGAQGMAIALAASEWGMALLGIFLLNNKNYWLSKFTSRLKIPCKN